MTPLSHQGAQTTGIVAAHSDVGQGARAAHSTYWLCTGRCLSTPLNLEMHRPAPVFRG